MAVANCEIFQNLPGRGLTEETLENLSLSTWFPSQDSNHTHPDYKPELLSPEPGVHNCITHLKF